MSRRLPHIPMPVFDSEFIDRFWKSVDIRGPDECWEWLKSVSKHGGVEWYGKVKFQQKSYVTSRVAFALSKFDPGERSVLHTCDVARCCNPNHLRADTLAENVADMMRKGRHRVRFGEGHGNAKLTEDQVRRIYLSCRSGERSMNSFATEFGVSPSVVLDVVRDRSWKHITSTLTNQTL